MAATWDTIDRYVVISTDTHAGADLYDYKPYLPVGCTTISTGGQRPM